MLQPPQQLGTVGSGTVTAELFAQQLGTADSGSVVLKSLNSVGSGIAVISLEL